MSSKTVSDLGLGVRVQARQCDTCIYRRESPLDIKALEAAIADGHGGFANARRCHHSDSTEPAVCRGFWNRHKDAWWGGQIAQRLDRVIFVTVDVLKREMT